MWMEQKAHDEKERMDDGILQNYHLLGSALTMQASSMKPSDGKRKAKRSKNTVLKKKTASKRKMLVSKKRDTVLVSKEPSVSSPAGKSTRPAEANTLAVPDPSSDENSMIVYGGCHVMHRRPDQFDRLFECHDAIAALWPTSPSDLGPVAEIRQCMLSHKYYNMWAPDKVRCLLLAESGALTNRFAVEGPLAPEYQQEFGQYHKGHVNLVYCLTYGERHLLHPETLKHLPDSAIRGITSGTYQFWRLLAALAGDLDFQEGEKDPLEDEENIKAAFSHLEGNRPELVRERVRAKISVLLNLKRRGIFLSDVCPVPIYRSGGNAKVKSKTGNVYTTKTNKLKDSDYKAIIKAAWETYSKHVVSRHQPEKTILLGIKMNNAIGKDKMAADVAAGGSLFVGTRQHPSYNGIIGKKFTKNLRDYRKIGLECEQSCLEETNGSQETRVTNSFDLHA